MSKNGNLHKAKRGKNDEFYTQLKDIEDEMRHYKHHFKDKIVYCNCDDPQVSNFFKYFSLNFEHLGLKKLITSCYRNEESDKRTEGVSDKAVWLEYTGERDGGTMPRTENVGVHEFEGDGDFRSEESINLLKEADIVVTNPPFSLFREHVAQLVDCGKKFIILGNTNAITYKEIFPLLRDSQIWLGHQANKTFEFGVPDSYILTGSNTRIDEDGNKYIKVPSIAWYTNLDFSKRHEDIILFRSYEAEKYPIYENYDAINVDRIVDIPMDYDGVMGVPITYLDKYNPEQFEIVGLGIANLGKEAGVQPYKPEHREYRKNVQKRGVVDGDLYMIINEEVKVPYARILIKNKKVVKP